MLAKLSSRPVCCHCERPVSHCLCAVITVQPNRIKVLILQHPDEQKHPLNTARLAKLGLQQAELWVGEHFPQLEQELASVDLACLLFPAQEHHIKQPLEAVAPTVSALLVVPDGTWRNVRQLLRLNPCLSHLPHLSLAEGEPSQYRVRRTRETAAIATIEAIVRSLNVLEPEQDFTPVLAPFTLLVEQQIQAMGPERYQRYYGQPAE